MNNFGRSVILPADLAAIPDFQSGAMENWGLTTYRETGLLYDPDKSSPSEKLAITKVIAHELAHQVADCSSFQISELFLWWTMEVDSLKTRAPFLCPVVWKPGDDGVVERPVAQRGFRQIHGVYFCQRHQPRAACGE